MPYNSRTSPASCSLIPDDANESREVVSEHLNICVSERRTRQVLPRSETPVTPFIAIDTRAWLRSNNPTVSLLEIRHDRQHLFRRNILMDALALGFFSSKDPITFCLLSSLLLLLDSHLFLHHCPTSRSGVGCTCFELRTTYKTTVAST